MLTQPSLLIPGPSGKLEVIVAHPENEAESTPLFIMCHPNPLLQGSMHNKVVTTTCKAFLQLGCITVRFNFRGVGLSEGVYGHYQGECQDLQCVTRWAQDLYPQRPLWLSGFSFGSFIAYKMANTLNAHRLLSIAPALKYGENIERYADLPEPQMPWTILIPEADEVVSSQDTYAWLSTVKSPYQVIGFPNVSHFFHGALGQLREVLMEVGATL